jgi:hypothetical protein
MKRGGALAFAAILLLAIALRAQSASAAILEARITGASVSASLAISAYQNFTAFPEVPHRISDEDAAKVEAIVNAALAERSPGLSAELRGIEVASDANWMNLTLRLEIRGAISRRGSIAEVDCSWRSLSIRGPVIISGFDFNGIGRSFLRPALEAYEGHLGFYENGTILVTKERGLNTIGNLTPLDLSPFRGPLDSWRIRYGLRDGSTAIELHPRDFIMRVDRIGNATRSHIIRFRYSARIVAEGVADPRGDKVSLAAGDRSSEAAMALSIASLAALCLYLRGGGAPKARLRAHPKRGRRARS